MNGAKSEMAPEQLPEAAREPGRSERIAFLEAALEAALEELGHCYGCPYAQTELHGFVIIRRLEPARVER